MNVLLLKFFFITIVLMSTVLILIQVTSPIHPPMRKIQKVKRSFLIAIGLVVVLFSSFILMELFHTKKNTYDFSATSSLTYLCCTSPFFFVGFLGSYIDFGIHEKLQTIADKITISGNSKEE